jgi:hypothetical protein
MTEPLTLEAVLRAVGDALRPHLAGRPGPREIREAAIDALDALARIGGFAQPAGARFAAGLLEEAGQMRAGLVLRTVAAAQQERLT